MILEWKDLRSFGLLPITLDEAWLFKILITDFGNISLLRDVAPLILYFSISPSY